MDNRAQISKLLKLRARNSRLLKSGLLNQNQQRVAKSIIKNLDSKIRKLQKQVSRSFNV